MRSVTVSKLHIIQYFTHVVPIEQLGFVRLRLARTCHTLSFATCAVTLHSLFAQVEPGVMGTERGRMMANMRNLLRDSWKHGPSP